MWNTIMDFIRANLPLLLFIWYVLFFIRIVYWIGEKITAYMRRKIDKQQAPTLTKTVKLNYDTAYLDSLNHFLILQWRNLTTNGKVIDQYTLKALQREIDIANTLPIVKEYGHFAYVVNIPDSISDNWHIRFESTKIEIT